MTEHDSGVEFQEAPPLGAADDRGTSQPSAVSRVRGLWSRHPALASLCLAVLVTVCAYPGVVFLGGSLASTGLNGVVNPRFHPGTVSAYPNPEELNPRSGLFDIGARVWQLEPATRFMSRSIRDGQDPSWNPYSAAGSLGPETLVDMKESPFVVAVAVLGASVERVHDCVARASRRLAVLPAAVLRTRTLSMSRLAALAACVVFILNGWAVAGVSSQMAAPYIVIPMVLYALTEYQRTRRPWRLLVAVLVYAGLLMTTFLPTMVLMVAFVHAVALCLDVPRLRSADPDMRSSTLAGRALLRQAVVPLLALPAAAYVLLPDIDALRHSGDDLASYGKPDLPTKAAYELLSVLTPRQLYRWYRPDTLPPDVSPAAWTMYLGVVPVVVIAAALPRARGVARTLLIVVSGIGVFGLLMHVGMPGVKWFGNLPGLRPISGRYWASLPAVCLTVAFGVAIETARRRSLSARVAVVTSACILVAFALGLATRPTTSLSYVAVGIVVALVGLAVLPGLGHGALAGSARASRGRGSVARPRRIALVSEPRTPTTDRPRREPARLRRLRA